MPTTLTNGIQLPDKGSVDWYSSMQSNYNLIDTHLGNTDIHVTAEDKANWNSKQGSLSQAQLDAIAQVATNTSDIATLQSGKANASHTHSSSDITDIGDYATKQYVDNSISGLVDNAPAALDTLKELSTALNDDANFASTVTTALAAKANSADLATVATSGDYDDLSNKPSIPTNTSDLNNNSGFVTLNDFDIPSKTSDLTNDSGFITSSDVPTSTSDLINDSNFVDTSNPAVSSGITATKVTSYDSHIADTDIHVTTADKTKWNNGVSQSYVFRYSSTALVASSTNSNTLLDNTDNLKVGDKVIDSSGVLFSVTAIDTVNSTFTVGSALIDLALDANVVHTSGNETVGGIKTFSDDTYIKSLNFKNEVASTSSSSSSIMPIVATVTYTDQSPSKSARLNFRISADGTKSLYPHENNQYALGLQSRKWSEIHATTYYYGSSDTEFSQKFVTTDTAQTIDSEKTFNNIVPINGVYIGNEPSATFRTVLLLRSRYDTVGKSGWLVSKFRSNSSQGALSGSDTVFLNFDVLENEVRTNGILRFNLSSWSGNTPGRFSLIPNSAIESALGSSINKWATINGLNPSSLGMPDLSNGVDISSYITVTDNANVQSTYTPPSNGWVCVKLSRTSGAFAVLLQQENICGYGRNIDLIDGTTIACSSIPVIKGIQVLINSALANGVVSAYFYPCLGNV